MATIDLGENVVKHIEADVVEVVGSTKSTEKESGFISDNKWVGGDGIASIELLEVFGNDLTVVNSARVSFAKESTEMLEKDERLIKYLAKHKHISVFFHPQLRFRVKMNLFTARQWFKHTIGCSINECSKRYTTIDTECWVPSPDEIREKSVSVKQGSKSSPPEEKEKAHAIFKQSIEDSMKAYEELLSLNVCPEQARAVLPMATYTLFMETMSLHAAFRIYCLRTDPGAQKEIREFAEAMGVLIEKHFPISWNALKDSM
jgi:thymidylate synthase (FAD)